jgi:two-component system cell cycle sensor histidine kinase/response regulator CckA
MDSPMALLEGSETVLVVDDELFVLSVAQDILTRHGYRVLIASNGQEALHLAKSWPDMKIDVALLDIVMPLITGPELALELQKIRPKLPVIFISAYPEIAEHRPPDLRHLQFVAKPFTSLKLVSKIREVLDSPLSKASSQI